MSKSGYVLSEDCLKCVLDKIRSEIESEIVLYSGTGEEVIQAYVDGLMKSVNIVDKYRKGESE